MYSHSVFQSSYTVLHSWVVYEVSNLTKFLSVLFCFSFCSHPSESEVISCGLDWHFLSTSGDLLKKCLFRFSVHFKLNYYCFSYWIIKDFIYSEYNSVSSYRIMKSSHTLSRFFYFLIFWSTKFLRFDVHFALVYLFVPCVYSFIIKLRQHPVFLKYLCFILSLIVLALPFRSLIHFE